MGSLSHRYCSSCSHPLTPGAPRCPNCNAPVPGVAPPRRSAAGPILGAIVAAVLVGVVGLTLDVSGPAAPMVPARPTVARSSETRSTPIPIVPSVPTATPPPTPTPAPHHYATFDVANYTGGIVPPGASVVIEVERVDENRVDLPYRVRVVGPRDHFRYLRTSGPVSVQSEGGTLVFDGAVRSGQTGAFAFTLQAVTPGRADFRCFLEEGNDRPLYDQNDNPWELDFSILVNDQ